ncbi:hypothetical protein [Streptomyces sp. NPDC059786]|uniref:hypothetical protein n=1 Tax=Streptomyces sp. NPDC059786 TaxID=3346946 RepID=UPI003665394C
MVQIDVFWAYGIGAATALAEAPILSSRCRRSVALTATLSYLSVVFIPCGMWLLTEFPGWETMQVTAAPPGWFAGVFCLGVIVSAVGGFLCTARLIRRDRTWWAFLQWVWPYTAMFFVLLHGWDGTGLRRFLMTDDGSHDAVTGAESGNFVDTETVVQWLQSSVAWTLFGMGLVVIPALVWTGARLRNRALDSRSARPGYAFAGLLAFWALGPCPAVAALAAAGAVLWSPVAVGVLTLAGALLLARPGSRTARWTTARLLPVPARRPESVGSDQASVGPDAAGPPVVPAPGRQPRAGAVPR